jgi:membrane-bound lytic murein transglycosylase B
MTPAPARTSQVAAAAVVLVACLLTGWPNGAGATAASAASAAGPAGGRAERAKDSAKDSGKGSGKTQAQARTKTKSSAKSSGHSSPKAAAVAAAAAPAAAAAEAYGARPDVVAFAQEVAQRRGLDPAWVQAQLAQARLVPAVQRLIMPPPAGTAKNWAAYRARFIDRARIEAGLQFWRTHATWLERAQARWGVPAEVVVAVIGVETFYGRHMGSFRVLDALATLSFDFPRGRSDRSAFFREELEALLVMARREGVEAGQWRGSFAGAMGLPQFMPGSLARWAVDFDDNGHIDLHTSAADAVGSVAHYLSAFGWRAGLPTHYRVAAPVDTRDRAVLLGPDILPTFTAAQFAERGAELPPEAREHQGLLALVELQNGEAAPSYVAGTTNFYAVTRYNWSAYYAMAVIDLAQELHRARKP